MKAFESVVLVVLSTVLICMSANANTLVGAWDFEDDAPGGYTADLSGVSPALDGQLQMGATIQNESGRGKVLNPNGGGVLLGWDPKLYYPYSITVQYWHKKQNPNENWRYIIGQGGGNPRHFNNTGGMIFAFQSSDSGWNPVNFWRSAYPNPQEWHHVLATYDGQYLYGYIDGVQVAKIFRGGTINGGTNYWSMGRQWNGDASGSWHSGDSATDLIDDVAIWNGYAPPDVVQGLYDGTYTIYDAPIELIDLLGDYPEGDYDRNGFVNIDDLKQYMQVWMADCGSVDCGSINLNEDTTVNLQDYAPFALNWLFDDDTGPLMSIEEDVFGVPTFKVDDDFTTSAVFSHNWPHPSVVPVKGFADRGTIIQDFGGSDIKNMWLRTDPDRWDYSNPVDQRIAYLTDPVTGDPNVLLMPWMAMTPPQWWLDDPANQDELEKQDFGSGPQIVHTDGQKYPSLASQKWRDDMTYALENYLDYLYLNGYMNNIAGFKLGDVGCGGENLWRYSWMRQPGGFGLRTKEGFQDWLREKYNNDINALETAWNDTGINSFDNVDVPSRSERRYGEGNLTFRDPSVYMNVIDFERYWNELIVDTMDYFAGVIKRKTNETKLVGGFYCYMYEWCGNPEDGHQALGKYNEAENLDFIWQTASYQTRTYINGADVLRGPGYTNVLHGKQWANSNDTATYLATEQDIQDRAAEFGFTDTLERNKRMFLRSAGFNICNVGYLQEFFALHDHWFNAADLVDAAGDVNYIYMNSINYDRGSNAEVLVVSDELSCSYATYKWEHPLLRTTLRSPQLALVQMGAANDQILLDDIALLPNPDQYKLVVFLNCFHMDDTQRALVDSLKGNGRILMFCYAPGYFNGKVTSEAAMESMTGMNLSVSGSESWAYPRVEVQTDHPLGQDLVDAGVSTFGPTENVCKRIWVDDPTADRLGRDPSYYYRNNETMAIKDMGTWKSIYVVTPDMPAAAYREIARYAGAHIYNESNDTFYVNKSYVCIHPNHNEGSTQSRTITFPQAVDIYDAETETLLQSNTISYTQNYDGGDTKVYRYEVVE